LYNIDQESFFFKLNWRESTEILVSHTKNCVALCLNCNNTKLWLVVLLDVERAGDGQRVEGGVARRCHGAGDGGHVPGGVDAIRRLRPDRGLWGPDPDHPGDGRTARSHGKKLHLLQPHHLRWPQHAGRPRKHSFFFSTFPRPADLIIHEVSSIQGYFSLLKLFHISKAFSSFCVFSEHLILPLPLVFSKECLNRNKESIYFISRIVLSEVPQRPSFKQLFGLNY